MPHGRSTVGMMQVRPNSRNTIPGHVFFTVDLRHPDADTLSAMGEAFQNSCAAIAGEIGLALNFKEIWYSAPVKFDAACVKAVENAATTLGYAHEPIISGAGHDAVYLSRVAPTAMVFIPCADGISHNEIEAATKADCGAGAQVLLRAMVERANAT
jgi:N-carbamoyl-L-amino-acid hydrolase